MYLRGSVEQPCFMIWERKNNKIKRVLPFYTTTIWSTIPLNKVSSLKKPSFDQSLTSSFCNADFRQKLSFKEQTFCYACPKVMTCMQVHLDGGRGLILRGKHGVERIYMLYHFFFSRNCRASSFKLWSVYWLRRYIRTRSIRALRLSFLLFSLRLDWFSLNKALFLKTANRWMRPVFSKRAYNSRIRW